jgi:hypothetical protein
MTTIETKWIINHQAGIKENPKAYDNPIFNHTYYEHVCNKILSFCGFHD